MCVETCTFTGGCRKFTTRLLVFISLCLLTRVGRCGTHDRCNNCIGGGGCGCSSGTAPGVEGSGFEVHENNQSENSPTATKKVYRGKSRTYDALPSLINGHRLSTTYIIYMQHHFGAGAIKTVRIHGTDVWWHGHCYKAVPETYKFCKSLKLGWVAFSRA